ncbi:hypothetical protein Gotri_011801, partial [Gossypium trilobum]|nr:hypothetical protein [Gossypium trilobum]
MDGSSRGCLIKTEIGGVLGDKNGCVLALCSGPMGEGYAANAKLLAIENGLEIFANSGRVGLGVNTLSLCRIPCFLFLGAQTRVFNHGILR